MKKSTLALFMTIIFGIAGLLLAVDAGVFAGRDSPAPKEQVRGSEWTLPVFDEKGSSQQIVPVSFIEAGAIVSYHSLDSDVATVDMGGNITAVSPGETDIVVKTELNGEITHHTVNVICIW